MENDGIMNRLILASASPRRSELLAMAGYTFEVQASDKEEIFHSTQPGEIVRELALLKAEDVAEKNERKNLTVIGADTVVSVDGEILGKPVSRSDAFSMIKKIEGKQHQVYTGIAVIEYDAQGYRKMTSDSVCTKVFVAPMTDCEIREYTDTQDVMDKAGAYAIQGVFGARYIDRIEGSYFNVVGLPVSHLCRILDRQTDEV